MRSSWCLLLSFIFILLLAFAGSTLALAQTGTTSIRGSILDKSGAVVPGATVTLINRALSVERSTTTNASGQYEFLAVQPGTYELDVESKGFKKSEQKNIELLVNNPTTLNVTLQLGTSTELVEVSALSETINTTDASIGVAFGENQVKQLPLESRNVGDLLAASRGGVYRQQSGHHARREGYRHAKRRGERRAQRPMSPLTAFR